MCAIAFLIDEDAIHVYSDGYGQNIDTKEEIWHNSKIIKVGGNLLLYMGRWNMDFLQKIKSLKGSPKEIAEKASIMMKEFYAIHPDLNGHGSQLLIFGFEIDGKPHFYDIKLENDFDINEPEIYGIFGGMGLNGVDEENNFTKYFMQKYLDSFRQGRKPDTQKIGLQCFKDVIEENKNRGHFGGEIFTETIGLIYSGGQS